MKTKVLFFISLFLSILVSSSPALAQSSVKDEVVLTVSGEGKTTDEATKTALRSAISQAYGVFVSANTTLLNDDLVKDEIATITSGNIKKYDEVANITLANGNKSVTLKATVCISKLVSYAKSKGASTEFAGAAFGMNIKMKQLNKENERIAISHLIDIMAATLPYCYDIKCEVGEPKISEQQGGVPSYDIPFVVSFNPTQTAQNLEKTFVKSFESIGLSREEFLENRRLNLNPSRAEFQVSNGHLSVFLRNEEDRIGGLLQDMMQIVRLEALNFVVIDNVGNTTYFTTKSNEEERKYDHGVFLLDIEATTKKTSPIEFIYDQYQTSAIWYESLKDFNWSPFNRPAEVVRDGGESKFYYALFNSPQLLYFVMRIPQSDISKYSSFEVKRAYNNIMERLANLK